MTPKTLVLPNAVDLELSVIGCCIEYPEAFDKVSDILKEGYFYNNKYRIVFEAVKSLAEKYEPINLISVTSELKQTGRLDSVDGIYGVTVLTNDVVSDSNIEYYARIMAQKFTQREIIRITSEAQKKAFDDTTDVFDLLETTKSALENLDVVSGGEIATVSDKANEVMETVVKNTTMEREISGRPTGFKYYDEFNKGDQNGLTVIGARPSQGKTAYAIQKSVFQAAETPVGIITYEMSAKSLAARCISVLSGISFKDMLFKKLGEDQVSKVADGINKIQGLDLYLITPKTNSLDELSMLIHTLYYKYGVKNIVIDYLQKIESTSNESIQMRHSIRKTINKIHTICNNFEIAITLISELRRHDGRSPIMSDMMESSAVEYAADVVLLMCQPASSEYGMEEIKIKSANTTISAEGIVVIDQVKGRNVGTTKFYYDFIGDNMTFKEKNINFL